jgi:hypothetical protein
MNRLPTLAAIKKIVEVNPPANRYRDNPVHRARVIARTRISYVIRSGRMPAEGKAAKMLGCDYATFKQHIESRFQDGMGWHNYGEWEIDHITPLAMATCLDELAPLLLLSNIQPLWARENIKKGSLPPEFFKSPCCQHVASGILPR